MTRLFKILLTLDQAIGPWLFSDIYPDESISAFVYRTRRRGWIRFVNWLARDKFHCEIAYLSEKNGTQNAPEYRA